jgi:hypothetical protein
MKIRVLGGGWYGCHITLRLLEMGHDAVLWESRNDLFSGASGANPARLHLGFHYPRSKLTRAMSQEHYGEFRKRYAHLTRGVPVNVYAVAANDSLVDFGTYCQVLKGEVEYVTVANTAELGLENVEGALLTGERHIRIDLARDYFKQALGARACFLAPCDGVDLTKDESWFDYTIDCTFCALDSKNIDRYEPCITGILSGPTGTAITIMDGPFPSIYPWDESRGLSSLTSALHTPIKRCSTREEAEEILKSCTDVNERIWKMYNQMAGYYPALRELYRVRDVKLSIRAMPRSGADARLVDVIRVGKRALRVRAGKIDAIEHATRIVASMISEDA